MLCCGGQRAGGSTHAPRDIYNTSPVHVCFTALYVLLTRETAARDPDHWSEAYRHGEVEGFRERRGENHRFAGESSDRSSERAGGCGWMLVDELGGSRCDLIHVGICQNHDLRCPQSRRTAPHTHPAGGEGSLGVTQDGSCCFGASSDDLHVCPMWDRILASEGSFDSRCSRCVCVVGG